MPRAVFLFTLMVLCVAAAACSDDSSGEGAGSCEFESTFAAIQSTVFEGGGCTQNACHGESFEASGGLDLRAGASYAALVRVPSSVDSEIQRVFPGDQDLSLLYRKLAETTQELAVDGLGQEMPLGGSRLSDDQLEAIAAWIRAGAPETTVVEGTLNLLGCEGNFVAEPNKIVPLPAPDPSEGVQFYAGGWNIDAEAEDEVCYATYYDFTDVVPPEYQVDCDEFGEGRKCFAFGRNELAQDALSHHSIITVYTPESNPKGGDWGPWACLGGDNAGSPCDPAIAGECGPRSACTTPVQTSVACVGYAGAPNDFSLGSALGAQDGDGGTQIQLSGAQESTFIDSPPPGVYSRLPLTGFIGWNSHGFNLTTSAATIEQWVNLTFVPEVNRTWLRQQIFESGDIFAMSTVAPFTKREICNSFTLPQYSQLLSLSSHMHKRGELFRIWLPPNDPCSVQDCNPPDRDPDYVSRLYDDPVYTYYDPPLGYEEGDVPSRTFRACAVYDNGADNPLEVKRNTEAPNTPVCDFVLAYCGCPARDRSCLGGPMQGTSCGGEDAACGDEGLCDACPVFGGVTTDDEMFIPLGSYFVQPPSP
ncbi:MAG: hypothetical protein AAF436_12725 [Myxococcota bacterium]